MEGGEGEGWLGEGDLEWGSGGWEQYELVAGGKSCSYTGSPVAALPHEAHYAGADDMMVYREIMSGQNVRWFKYTRLDFTLPGSALHFL